jgi:nucleoside-diphosphate kinase
MAEKTFVLIKPDGVYRALIGAVIAKFESAGLKVVALKMVTPDQELAGKHYMADEGWMKSVGTKTKAAYKEKGIDVKETELEIGKRIRNQLLTYLTEGPVVAAVLEGNDAIYITRKIVGSTEPRKADPSSIRGMYSSDSYETADKGKRAVKNIIHASEDLATANREIALWFKKGEITTYKRVDEHIIY